MLLMPLPRRIADACKRSRKGPRPLLGSNCTDRTTLTMLVNARSSDIRMEPVYGRTGAFIGSSRGRYPRHWPRHGAREVLHSASLPSSIASYRPSPTARANKWEPGPGAEFPVIAAVVGRTGTGTQTGARQERRNPAHITARAARWRQAPQRRLTRRQFGTDVTFELTVQAHARVSPAHRVRFG
jgi:hypothetical protein